jgi:hypothetical protein
MLPAHATVLLIEHNLRGSEIAAELFVSGV